MAKDKPKTASKQHQSLEKMLIGNIFVFSLKEVLSKNSGGPLCARARELATLTHKCL
jgi:hypothetical protein